ncbi:MAG: phage/plasmid replication protein [Bacteroidota bacterium]
MWDARLSRVDVGANLIVSQPVATMLTSIEIKPRARVGTYQGTVYIKNDPRTLRFYDKRAEVLKKGRVVPHAGKHVLRYELRIKSVKSEISVPAQDGHKPDIWLSDLKDPEVFVRLANAWRAHFHEIRFKAAVDISTVTTPTELREALAVHGLHVVGSAQDLRDVIDANYQNGRLKRHQRDGLKALITKLTSDGEGPLLTDVEAEFRAAVDQAYTDTLAALRSE